MDYKAFRQSISEELMAMQARVQNLIGRRHHPSEDGRYKESILIKTIQQYLPQNVAIGTGFVIGNDEISKQIDIIVYDNSFPVLMKLDNFVIVSNESVLAIIEVKTNICTSIFVDTYEQLTLMVW